MGVPNLTGALIATAGTAPITAAIPEPSTCGLMLGGAPPHHGSLSGMRLAPL
jgi:hypothetical protein